MKDLKAGAAAAGDDKTDAFRAALSAYVFAVDRRNLPVVDLSALADDDRHLLTGMIDLADRILSHKKSLTFGIETLRDGFAIFNEHRELIHANKAFRAFFGTTLRADEGVAFESLLGAIAHYELVDLEGESPEAWMARFTTPEDSSHVVHMRGGRSLRWTLRHNPMGHLVVLATDITTEIRRQHELDLARRQAESAASAKTGFLTHMSHEFRTPMNGVIGMAELLCDSGLDPERQRYAETIRNSAEALLSIINDILDYARGRSEDIRLTERSFDLEAMAIEVGTLLQPEARGKGLDLRIFFDPLTPRVWIGDTGRVRQIILNLLGNAVKYTLAGWVRLQVLADRERVHILVHDSGPGIPDDRADDVFKEFSRLDAGMAGSGLGLSITAQLVSAMGGQLWLSSREGEGSTFATSLPLRRAGFEPDDGAMRHSVWPEVASGCEPVVAVQDNLPLSRHLRRLFASAAVPLQICSDRAEVEARLRHGPAPLLVMVYCNDDPEETMARISLIRILSPDTRIWLMLPASRQCAGMRMVDQLVTLPSSRAAMVDPVLAMLTDASAGAWQREPARPAAPAPSALPPSLRPSSLAPSTAPSEARPPAADHAPRRAGSPTIAVSHSGRAMRVLIADDNATNRLVIEKMLRHCTLDLATAENGQQALEVWRQRRPDLILMDVSMPVMDGREATRTIRRIEALENMPRTRIVAVTAAVAEEDRVSVMRAGMDEIIAKPVRRGALFEQISRFAPPGVAPPLPATPEGGAKAD